MGLRINTNVAALNSYNNLSRNQNNLESSFQKLSSGLRINKAADDAAGLSIAQGLTSQINGLTQAVANANDGINVAQIADGALGTTQDILQRMRVLVNKAANIGTQDSNSWGAIQKEIKNLNTQLDNIADQTKFGQTQLLDGSYNKNFQVGADSGDVIKLNLSDANVSSKAMVIDGQKFDLNTQLHIAANGASSPATNWTPESGSLNILNHSYDAGTDTWNSTGNEGFFEGDATTVVRAPSGQEGWVVQDSVGDTIGTITQGNNGVFTVSNTKGEVLGQVNATSFDEQFGNVTMGAAVTDVASITGGSTLGQALTNAAGVTLGDITSVSGNAADGWVLENTGGDTLATVSVKDGIYTISDASGNEVAWINANEGAEAATAANVTYSTTDANNDLDNLNKAIDSISNFRSQIGAVQNQLSYTVDNLQTAITNVTASRSNLTDADLAEEVTNMTQSQILTQAATSVLAQANSAPQAILQLLQ